MERRKALIDIDTGELLTEIRHGDKIKIIRAESLACIGDDNGTVRINQEEDFVKVYTRSLFEISKVLTGIENQLMNYLITYMSYNTGIFADGQGRIIRRSRMAEETGNDERTIDRILEGLIRKQVIGKHRTGRMVCFLGNPYIFMKGSMVNKTLKKMFENTKWAKMCRKD